MERTIRILSCLALTLLAPAALAAQTSPELRADIDTLLEGDSIDATLFDLPERFFGHVMLLLPELALEDQEVLAAAIEQAFDPLQVRSSIVDLIMVTATPELVDPLVASRAAGAEAEMTRLTEEHVPEESFEAFVNGLEDPPAERLRLLAGLADARGAGDFDLLLDQALSAAAHRLVTLLGGAPGPFEPLSDASFEGAYRQRILTRALELLHGMAPVPDELVGRVAAIYTSQEGRWYVDRMTEAVQEAALQAGRRVESSLVPTGSGADPPPSNPDAFCQTSACGYLVEWRGSPPIGTNGRYGAAGDLDARVLEWLSLSGYQLTRGLNAEGLTLRLRPRTTTAICDFLSGTDNRGCQAIDDVRVDFLGADPERGTPEGFLVRNRCGSDEIMDVDGISALVAARVQHLLAGEPANRMPGPSC